MCVNIVLPGQLQMDEIPFCSNVVDATAAELWDCSNEASVP